MMIKKSKDPLTREITSGLKAKFNGNQ